MQKHGRDQSVNLTAQYSRLIVAAVLDESIAVDIHQITGGLVESDRDLEDEECDVCQANEEGER